MGEDESWADADASLRSSCPADTDHIDFYMLHGWAYTWKKSQDLKLLQWAQQKKVAGRSPLASRSTTTFPSSRRL
jgi:predicted aldo/keto reductase-like oxidoreductase